MNGIDLLIVVIILFTVYTTSRKGFVRIVAEILGFAVATGLAYYWFMDLGEILAPLLRLQARIVYVITFAILWLATFIVFVVLGKIFQKVVNQTFLRPLNLIASIVLGLLKGSLYAIFLLIIPLILASFVHPPLNGYLDQSFTMKKVKPLALHFGKRIKPDAMPNIMELDKTLRIIELPSSGTSTGNATHLEKELGL